MSNVPVASIAIKFSDLPISGIVLISGIWSYAISNGIIGEYSSIAYPGRENIVVKTVVDWMDGKEITNVIK